MKLVDAYMTNAVQSLNTDIAIDFYRHGQSIAGSNRSIFMNGLSEAINDGINPSWTATCSRPTVGSSATVLSATC